MIYRKLQSACGGDFSILLTPGKHNGMRVVVSLPAKKVDDKGEEVYGPRRNL